MCCNCGLAQMPYNGGISKYANPAQHNGYTSNYNQLWQQQPVYADSTAMLRSMLRLKKMESVLPGALPAGYYSSCMGFFAKRNGSLKKLQKFLCG
ncbi:hypothetical protein [Agriterribacter sp.]|uniref:hypothetical protein n=1 Tax=Agriterribacter sp. TaxID=2821509 RepID=UPI002CB0D54D|nr:hypothetical protein [Agriterribacter sp.]HTN07816.1 hypothetical protein [Agriterribacter sp.]